MATKRIHRLRDPIALAKLVGAIARRGQAQRWMQKPARFIEDARCFQG